MGKELNNEVSTNNFNKKANNLTDEEFTELFKKMKSGDNEARDKIIISNVGLINKVIKDLNNPKMLFEDMMEVGIIGLINAVDNYDSNKGKFSTYAYTIIKNEIINAISEDRLISIKSQKIKLKKYYEVRDKLIENLGREPTDEEMKKNLDGILTEKDLITLNFIRQYYFIKSLSDVVDDEGTTLEELIGEEDIELTENIENKELLNIIYEVSKTLSPREKEIFDLSNNERLSDQEIAEKLGLTVSHVQRMKIRIIKKIKRNYRVQKVLDK